jgi:hypothetical protein
MHFEAAYHGSNEIRMFELLTLFLPSHKQIISVGTNGSRSQRCTVLCCNNSGTLISCISFCNSWQFLFFCRLCIHSFSLHDENIRFCSSNFSIDELLRRCDRRLSLQWSKVRIIILVFKPIIYIIILLLMLLLL